MAEGLHTGSDKRPFVQLRGTLLPLSSAMTATPSGPEPVSLPFRMQCSRHVAGAGCGLRGCTCTSARRSTGRSASESVSSVHGSQPWSTFCLINVGFKPEGKWEQSETV